MAPVDTPGASGARDPKAARAEGQRTAVVLFNLGGPDSVKAIRPFLFNFFKDKNIIRLPVLPRIFLAGVLSWRRARREAGVSYGLLGGKSPLLENSRAQARVLEAALGPGYRVFVSMRYWHPLSRETARRVKEFAPDHVVLLPLYPQYSTTTTRSSAEDWARSAAAAGLMAATTLVCCYPAEAGFIEASAALVKGRYAEAQLHSLSTGQAAPRVLFSAHGLPEDVIADGDPYQWQCEKTAGEIVRVLNIEGLDWQLCYQSRVGPKAWIGPSTEEAIRQAGRDNVPVVIYPHSFTNEHVETLVEIDIEYRRLATEQGVPAFFPVVTVGEAPAFIAGLADLVKKSRMRSDGVCSGSGARLCPGNFRRCPARAGEKREAA